jgi:thioester reductase-like protein
LSAAVHNGACVNASLGADVLRAVNVGGTATVLQLIGRKPLVYVSTIGVLRATSGYAQTKLEAEQLVSAVRARLGVGVGIVRPGAIGPASDGVSNPIDFRVLLAREMVRQGASPRSHRRAAAALHWRRVCCEAMCVVVVVESHRL